MSISQIKMQFLAVKEYIRTYFYQTCANMTQQLHDFFVRNRDKNIIQKKIEQANQINARGEYVISALIMDNGIHHCKIKIFSKKLQKTFLKTPSELYKDPDMIKRLNSIDANRIGYLAGLRDATREAKLKKKIHPILKSAT